MCLFNSISEVRKFLKKNQHKDFVWLYKVVKLEHKKLKAIYQHKYTYNIGENKSNSNRQNVSYRHISIGRGIHVALKSKCVRIKLWNDGDCKLLRVKCYIRDFLGTDGTNFVFKRIYIPKTEYKKALR